MIELRTLGFVDLKGPDGREIRAVLTQPKRVALLAYLAVATPRGFHRRDTLLGLFWPDLDQPHARGTLRKAVHALRQALGEDALVGRGDEELALAEGQVWCDAVAFERALDAQRSAEALELYRGDFLQGLFISGAPEFEHWHDAERARLRAQAAVGAGRLAEQAAAESAAQSASYWARRAVALAPDDEGAVRRLIEVLYQVGDRAGALHAYEELAQRLKTDYDSQPSAETRALFEGIRDTGGHTLQPRRPTKHSLPLMPPPVRRPWVLAATAAVVVLMGLAGAQALRRVRVHAAPGPALGAAAQLVFAQQPPASVPGNGIVSPPLEVTIKDAVGNIVPTGPVTLALGSAPWPGAALSGTLTVGASNGLASFADVRIDKPGLGYSLLATLGVARGVSAPFRVAISLASVGAFYRQSCAVTTGNDLYCWGNNASGQLGGSAGALDSVPVLVGAGLHFTQVTGGGDHTCGLAPGGAVYCWGRNHAGQLGNNTTTPSSVPVRVLGSGKGALIFHQVSAGAHHNCGIVTGNRAFCWGSNGSGQLGAATTALCGFSCRASPVAVATPPGVTFAALSGGGDHTCGITTAAQLYCWGRNDHGQLGDNTTTERHAPVRVVSPGGGAALTFTTVSAGMDHTCAVTPGSVAYCWGRNDHGQLGDNTTSERHAPVRVVGPGGGPPLALVGVSAGHTHTCAVSATGPAYCWGFNGEGELGDGTIIERHTPVLVAGSLLAGWTQVSAGDKHTCGQRDDGGGNLVYCWGSSELGQLGDGTLRDRVWPVRVVQ